MPGHAFVQVFHGLWGQGPKFYIDFMQNYSFNAIRIPLDLDLMLHDGKHRNMAPDPGQPWPSPLDKKSALEVLDYFIDQFAERGIIVLLDMHCLDTRGTNDSPVFFNNQFSIQQTIAGWEAMAKRYADKWNVFAFDAFNESFGGTWAQG